MTHIHTVRGTVLDGSDDKVLDFKLFFNELDSACGTTFFDEFAISMISSSCNEEILINT